MKYRAPYGSVKKRPVFVVFDYEGVDIFVVVDAIGLEMDFTLETNSKRVKEKLLKRT